jgi:hypothetical protein
MRPVELLCILTETGCRVTAYGGHLRVSGPRDAHLTPDVRTALVEHKAELLRLLDDGDPELRWRAEAMRSRIPAMYARRLSHVPDDDCLSCGEPLTTGTK